MLRTAFDTLRRRPVHRLMKLTDAETLDCFGLPIFDHGHTLIPFLLMSQTRDFN